jgi:hypothetical protein
MFNSFLNDQSSFWMQLYQLWFFGCTRYADGFAPFPQLILSRWSPTTRIRNNPSAFLWVFHPFGKYRFVHAVTPTVNWTILSWMSLQRGQQMYSPGKYVNCEWILHFHHCSWENVSPPCRATRSLFRWSTLFSHTFVRIKIEWLCGRRRMNMSNKVVYCGKRNTV